MWMSRAAMAMFTVSRRWVIDMCVELATIVVCYDVVLLVDVVSCLVCVYSGRAVHARNVECCYTVMMYMFATSMWREVMRC